MEIFTIETGLYERFYSASPCPFHPFLAGFLIISNRPTVHAIGWSTPSSTIKFHSMSFTTTFPIRNLAQLFSSYKFSNHLQASNTQPYHLWWSSLHISLFYMGTSRRLWPHKWNARSINLTVNCNIVWMEWMITIFELIFGQPTTTTGMKIKNYELVMSIL
jgi:hypothetical protein